MPEREAVPLDPDDLGPEPEPTPRPARRDPPRRIVMQTPSMLSPRMTGGHARQPGNGMPRRPSPVEEYLDQIDIPDGHREQGGRPTLMTRDVVEAILLALQAGAFRSTAARWAGIEPHRLAEWIKLGTTTEQEPYASFVRAVAKMEATAELRATRALATHDDWRALVAFLERRHANRWGRAQQAAPFPLANVNSGEYDLAALLVHSRANANPNARPGASVIDSYALPESIPRDPRGPRPIRREAVPIEPDDTAEDSV